MSRPHILPSSQALHPGHDRCRRRHALAMGCLIWLGLSLQPVAAEQAHLKIGGTGTTLETVRLLAAAFEKDNPKARITVLHSLGSTGGIKAAASGAIDIGVSARPLTDAERRQGITAVEYGRAPLVFATSRGTGATGITSAQLVDIYAGKRLTWPDGTTIRIIMRPAGDINTILLKAMSPQLDTAIGAAEKRPGMLFALTDQETLEHLEKVPGALGATSLSEVLSRANLLKALVLDGIEPTPQALTDGTYPVGFSFLMVVRTPPAPLVESFVAFVLSERGQKILAETGHAPPNLKPSRQP